MRLLKPILLSLSVLAAIEAHAKDWDVFGLKPNMSMHEASAVMAGACESKIGQQKREKIDIHFCRRSDGSTLEVWSLCDELLSVYVRKTVDNGNEAMRALYRDCLPAKSINDLGERRISVGCAESGSATIEFAQIGERLTITRSQVGDLSMAQKACRN